MDSQGMVYVHDKGIECIHVFDTEGNWKNTISTDTIEQTLRNIAGMAINNDGDIYISTPIFNCVMRSSKTNGYSNWEVWGPEEEYKNISSIGSITIDRDGMVYIANRDYSGDRVLILTSTGEFYNQFSVESSTGYSSIAVDINKNVYISDQFHFYKYNNHGLIDNIWTEKISNNNYSFFYQGMAAGKDGSLFVLNGFNDRIIKFDDLGNIIEFWNYDIKTTFFNPYRLAIDSDGMIFVSEYSNNFIKKLNPQGVFDENFGCWYSDIEDFEKPKDIAVTDKYIFVSQINQLSVLNLDGTLLTQWKRNGIPFYGIANDYIIPGLDGISILPNGELLVADQINDCINTYTFANGNLELSAIWGKKGPGNGTFLEPSDIVIGNDGSIYIVDTGNNLIQKFDKDKNFMLQWGEDSFLINKFDNPLGIAIDKNDFVYVTDNSKIQIFTSEGIFLTSLTDFLESENHNILEFKDIIFKPDGNLLVTEIITDSILELKIINH